MRFDPKTDPHYHYHKVYTSNELYDAMEERDQLKKQLAEVKSVHKVVDTFKLEMRKLKKKRLAKGHSLRVIAYRMGISKSQLAYLEDEVRPITEKVIEDYRAALKGGK